MNLSAIQALTRCADRLDVVLDDRALGEHVAGGADALDQRRAGLVVRRFARVGHSQHRDLQRHELSAFVDAGHDSVLRVKRRREGIAGRHLALFQADREPALALRRGAMGEGVGHDVAARLLLQAVVADRRRGLQGCFDVARLDRLPALVGMIGPDAGETVRLQFDPHLDAVGLRLAAGRALRVLRLRQDAEQVLHVMPDLVRNHISFGELAGLAAATTEAFAHVTEERGIEINAPVVRTIERPHCRLRQSATALHRTGKQPQPRHAILLAAIFENFGPCVFGVAEHGGDEIAHLILRRAASVRMAVDRVVRSAGRYSRALRRR